MNLKKSEYKIFDSEIGKELQHVERIGRICYKSEDKIAEGTADKFVRRLVANEHFAMTEHSVLVFKVDETTLNRFEDLLLMYKYHTGKQERFNLTVCEDRCIISGNLRSWRELLEFKLDNKYSVEISKGFADVFNRLDAMFGDIMSDKKVKIVERGEIELIDVDKEELTGYELNAHQYTSVWFQCDRGITHELVRHRLASFAQESTRYCNYSQDKFGNSISYIDIGNCFDLDTVMSMKSEEEKSAIWHEWESAMIEAEKHYFRMLELGAGPQIARGVLPNSTKAEIVVTANRWEWEHIFGLRDDAPAHPQMREIMTGLHWEMLERGRVSR